MANPNALSEGTDGEAPAQEVVDLGSLRFRQLRVGRLLGPDGESGCQRVSFSGHWAHLESFGPDWRLEARRWTLGRSAPQIAQYRNDAVVWVRSSMNDSTAEIRDLAGNSTLCRLAHSRAASMMDRPPRVECAWAK